MLFCIQPSSGQPWLLESSFRRHFPKACIWKWSSMLLMVKQQSLMLQMCKQLTGAFESVISYKYLWYILGFFIQTHDIMVSFTIHFFTYPTCLTRLFCVIMTWMDCKQIWSECYCFCKPSERSKHQFNSQFDHWLSLAKDSITGAYVYETPNKLHLFGTVWKHFNTPLYLSANFSSCQCRPILSLNFSRLNGISVPGILNSLSPPAYTTS